LRSNVETIETPTVGKKKIRCPGRLLHSLHGALLHNAYKRRWEDEEQPTSVAVAAEEREVEEGSQEREEKGECA